MTRAELLLALQQLVGTKEAPLPDREQRLLHDLQVHQIELEMQNRELRDAQSALEESRNRYADLYDFAPVAYCTLDAHGVVLELNLTAATLFVREREQALGRPLTSLVQLEEPKRFWRHLGTCAAGLPSVTELRLRVQGRVIDVEAVSVPVFVGMGQPRSFRTAFTDITLRKLAEAEREVAYASEQRLRQRIEALEAAHMEASAALAVGGDAGLSGVMNVIARHARSLAMASWVRLRLEDYAGQQEELLLHAPVELGVRGDSEGPTLTVRLAYGVHALGSLVLVRAAGEVPWTAEEQRAVQMLAERLSSALEIARLGAVAARETQRLSLLERVAGELSQVHDREAVRAALCKVAGDAIPEFADLCTIHLLQDGALQLICACHADQVRARLLAETLAAPQRSEALAAWLAEVCQQQHPQLFRVHDGAGRQTGEGDELPALAGLLESGTVIVTPLVRRNQLLGCLTFGRQRGEGYDLRLLTWAQEIAERCASALDTAQLLDELRSALEWRENLMATISHDLKNPLNAIALSARSLAPEGIAVERRSSHRQVDLIKRSAAHMTSMLNDLVSTTMLEIGSFRVEPRPMAVEELVSEACQLAAPMMKARNLELVSKPEAELPRVMADRENILRVLTNLLGNASKFTPSRGTIELAVQRRGDKVLFSVADTGPGVPEEQREHLFKRYWRGKVGGLGLGLFIAKSIIEAHGGQIWVEAKSQPGATFSFELPCEAQAN